MEDDRPNPDELLALLQAEEAASKGGKLKIFLGMAAGVGKTYAMLQEARELKEQGVDIVVGIVDTHERAETAELLKGLEVIPEKQIAYKERTFKELDVEAIIQRNPTIVLVDELAHDNIPGSQHAKRWQDVIEILNCGIDVYTTLNVQHIESLNDIVKEITDIVVRETIPDQVIEKASSIRLVDLTPDELLERLREGKVYLAGQSQIAIEHFFQPDRLTALRQIVLRYAADKVDRDLKKLLPTTRGPIEWRPREKILVTVSYTPHAQKLIRIAKRLATSLDAPFIALHVDRGIIVSQKDSAQLAKNLALARDLGAEVMTVHDPDVADGINRVANQRGVTQIILGRSEPRPFFAFLRGRSLLDRLTRECKHIDIHVIRVEKYRVSIVRSGWFFSPNERIRNYGFVLGFVFLLSLLNYFLVPYIGYRIAGFVFLLGTLALSPFFRTGPIFFASFLSACIWFFFLPEITEITTHDKEDIAFLALYPFTALILSILIERIRRQKESLAKSEKTTLALYDIVRNFASNLSQEEMLNIVRERLVKFLDGFYEFKIKNIDDKLPIGAAETLLSNDKEKIAAIWSFENGKEAGWSTEILPYAQNLYIPLKGSQEVMGLLIFRPKEKRSLHNEEQAFLYAVSQQLSNFLERSFILEREKQHEYFKQVDKIHKTILIRLSQAFQEPILSTKTALQELRENLAPIQQEGLSILDKIESSFDSFLNILNNISAMAQLSEGMVPLQKSRHELREIIRESCDNVKKACRDNKLMIKFYDPLPIVYIDYYLIQILLHNLLINAINYSSKNSTILVEAKRKKPYLSISVSNEGKHIPEDQLEAIFEKFYTIPDEKGAGIGLGLAVAKTIAELHQGFLQAENLPEKGTRFSLLLPIESPE